MTRWVITRDHLHEQGMSGASRVGWAGPGGATFRTTDPKDDPEVVHAFRMYDDDGELYYEGRASKPHSFAPLDHLGAPDAGCTEIRYLNKGKWETL